MKEKEIQFHAALLVCGSPKGNLQDALNFHDRAAISQFDYAAFRRHKSRLLHHLVDADYFDVFYEPYEHTTKEEQLTEKASLWIGEFYKWLRDQQLRLHSV